ncbi:MAG: S1 RNA-binding domain-containing protein [bacterium]
MASFKGKMDDDFFGTPLGAAMNVPFTLEVGDIISGRISKIDEEFVYVSTGFKSEGRIPVKEFKMGPDADREFKLDDEIEVMVDRVSGEEIYLSYEKVVGRRRWDELQKKFEDGEAIEAEIVQQVKGGYRMAIGLPRYAFLPGSHIGAQFDDPADVVGKKLTVYIIEFNRDSENIVVSHKEWKKKQQQDVEGEVFVTLKPDSIVEGRVTRLTNFGAFVDIGAIEGLVHVSELAWSRVNHPSQVLACGDTIKVKVLDVDPDTKKISLSLKQALQDPWDTVGDVFKVEQEIVGTVSKLVKFGAFIRLSDEFEGLLHISEFQGPGSDDKIKLTVGDEIKVKVLNVDSKGHRIKLGFDRESADAVSGDMKRYIDNGSNSVNLGDMIDGALDDK